MFFAPDCTSLSWFVSDDDAVAKRLFKEVRVLIWVMTSPQNLQSKATVVRDTWGRRANKLIFLSSETNKDFPTIGLNVSEGREHLTAKTVQGFRYIYQNHLEDADWFMKVSRLRVVSGCKVVDERVKSYSNTTIQHKAGV